MFLFLRRFGGSGLVSKLIGNLMPCHDHQTKGFGTFGCLELPQQTQWLNPPLFVTVLSSSDFNAVFLIQLTNTNTNHENKSQLSRAINYSFLHSLSQCQ